VDPSITTVLLGVKYLPNSIGRLRSYSGLQCLSVTEWIQRPCQTVFIFTARVATLYASAVYDVILCLSVCRSIRLSAISPSSELRVFRTCNQVRIKTETILVLKYSQKTLRRIVKVVKCMYSWANVLRPSSDLYTLMARLTRAIRGP